MRIQSEKYGDLLQAIAQVMVTKNIEIEKLHEEISKLNQMLLKAEREMKNGKQ